MIGKEKALEFRVGLFVIVGLVFLSAAVLRMEVVNLKPQQRIKVLFNFTGGLEQGAPVKLAGVPVGEVEAIEILKEAGHKTQVEVTAKLRQDITIDKDAEIRIGSHGLLGIKYLNIIPGEGLGEESATADTYEGYDPVMIDRVAVTGERIVQKMEGTVDALNRMIGNEEFRTQVMDNVEKLGPMIEEIRNAAVAMNEILRQLQGGKGLVSKLLYDEELYTDLRDLVKDVKRNPWKLLKKK